MSARRLDQPSVWRYTPATRILSSQPPELTAIHDYWRCATEINGVQTTAYSLRKEPTKKTQDPHLPLPKSGRLLQLSLGASKGKLKYGERC